MIKHKYVHFIKYLCFLILIIPLHTVSQTLTGFVKDSIGNPLEDANIIAFPDNENTPITYAISKRNGSYTLEIAKNTAYDINVSYLGYLSQTLQLKPTDTLSRYNFILKYDNQKLDEVKITYKAPIKVRKDTISYKVDAFTNGEERKLREVLKKLPGVEVDREGNVTVNGKKVNKLLVEGKTFFTGATKLGVNNIPADAVEEVEAIDNYNEIAFLKGLSDSDKMALNIKLKEGKKQFVFGDIEAGGGVEDRYIIHPTLFYYSPKTTVNFIGDANNTGKKSFTFQDYLNFEGGLATLIENPSGYANLVNSGFAQSLLNNDFVFNKNTFGAFNISQQLSQNTILSAYTINNASTTETRQENNNTYLTNNQATFTENRTTTGAEDTFFSLSKLTLKHTPTIEEDLAYDLLVKTSNGTIEEQIESLATQENNTIVSQNTPSALSVVNQLTYNKQFSYKHTTTSTANFTFSKNDNDRQWLFSQPIFSTLIPLEGTTPFQLQQQIASKNYVGDFAIKHYWVLNNFNHIYPIVGYSHNHQEFSSVDFQQNISDFNSSNFNNETIFKLNDPYIGFQYKAKIGDFIIKPGLVYHYYFWDVRQFDEIANRTSKAQLLPEALVTWDIRNTEKVNLKYNLSSQFNDASFFANRFRLQNFNSVYQGNESLENALEHRVSLTYYRFSLLKGLFYNGSINYRKAVQSIRNTTLIEGINQINTSIYTDLPEETISVIGSFSKKINTLKFTLSGNGNIANYPRIINNEVIDYQSNTYGYNFKTETFFEKWPNLEFGVKQTFSDFSSINFSNQFTQTEPYAILEYNFLKDFTLKADYRYTNFINKNEGIENVFEIGNASLFYNKEDSPWSFEVAGDNIFDVAFKNTNSFNQFLISDTRIFIQPRTILLKIAYKL